MDGQESYSKMMAPPPAPATPGPTQPSGRLESVTIRPTENGGFIVTCSRRGTGTPPDYQSKDYAFQSSDETLGFVAQELGAAPAVEAEPEDAAELMA